MGRRIGVLGGTFDPIHNGHLAMGRTVLNAFDLNRILFIPSARPPHKLNPGMASPDIRARMVVAALVGEQGFELSRLELERGGISYTADSLLSLRQTFPDDELFLIIGADNAQEMDTWLKPETVVSLATVVVVSREGAQRDRVPSGLREHMQFLEMKPVAISSTDIRSRVKGGQPIEELVPSAVLEIIQEERLYV